MKNYILITGVSSGIGKATLDHFYRQGYHILGSVRTTTDAKKILEQYPERVTPLIFDVTNSEELSAEVTRISPLLNQGNLAALINNAGFAVPGPLELLDDIQFENQINVNLFGVRRITNAFLPYLKSNTPGKIINISSVSGLINTPYLGAYCISKHALESMNEIYRRELSMFGIQVISVLPGPIKTKIWQKNIGQLDPYFDSPYGNILKNADELIKKSEKSGLYAEKVAQTIWNIFTNKNPKHQYIVHKNPFAIWIVSRILPSSWMDYLIKKSMAKGKNMRPI
ncbi:MAG: SDR family oxidoreductase [Saprospiraceae bacterium]|nr:SDR family oxidoreductase [Saprospiraceae bacterium]